MEYFKFTELEVKFLIGILFVEKEKTRAIDKKEFIEIIIKELNNAEGNK